jgi:hypothetical protein
LFTASTLASKIIYRFSPGFFMLVLPLFLAARKAAEKNRRPAP